MQAVYSVMNSWLTTVAPNVLWILAEQNVAPPAPENVNFGTYKIISIERQGIDGVTYEYRPGTDDFLESAFSYKTISVELNVYTVDYTAEDILTSVLCSISLQSINDMFNEAGIVTLGYTEPRNLSSIISGRYSKRFNAELELGLKATFDMTINRIAQVKYEGVINENTEIEGTINA